MYFEGLGVSLLQEWNTNCRTMYRAWHFQLLGSLCYQKQLRYRWSIFRQ